MEGLDEVFKLLRFNPAPLEAVAYFLPRLISGETLHGAERLIYRADVYGCEPKDLAAWFAPVPQAENSGDRFFFTPCKRLRGRGNRSARSAGAGSWAIQKTVEIENGVGVKVGEKRNLCFKKGKAPTGWLMEEYRCCPQEDVVAADGEKVLCKIYLSPNSGSAARQESAAYARQEQAEPPMPVPAPQPEPVTASTHVPKRPAPVAADPPRPKRTRLLSPSRPLRWRSRVASRCSRLQHRLPCPLRSRRPLPRPKLTTTWTGLRARWKNFSVVVGYKRRKKLSRLKLRTTSTSLRPRWRTFLAGHKRRWKGFRPTARNQSSRSLPWRQRTKNSWSSWGGTSPGRSSRWINSRGTTNFYPALDKPKQL